MSPANHDAPDFVALESDLAGNIARNDACEQATDKICPRGCSSRVVCWRQNASIEETHVTIRSKPKPEKKPATPASTTSRVLPMELWIGDRLVDETGEWEVVGRPYTTAGGKNARVRVQRVGEPAVTDLRTWGAHEKVSVKRA
jgi:hypothetical protein